MDEGGIGGASPIPIHGQGPVLRPEPQCSFRTGRPFHGRRGSGRGKCRFARHARRRRALRPSQGRLLPGEKHPRCRIPGRRITRLFLPVRRTTRAMRIQTHATYPDRMHSVPYRRKHCCPDSYCMYLPSGCGHSFSKRAHQVRGQGITAPMPPVIFCGIFDLFQPDRRMRGTGNREQ